MTVLPQGFTDDCWYRSTFLLKSLYIETEICHSECSLYINHYIKFSQFLIEICFEYQFDSHCSNVGHLTAIKLMDELKDDASLQPNVKFLLIFTLIF